MPKLKEIISEDVFKALPEEVRTKYAEVDLVDASGYVPKAKYDQEVEAGKGLKEQLGDRDKQLDDFKKSLGGKTVEEITKELSTLQETNKTAADDFAKQLADQSKNFALEIALRDAGARNSKAVLGLLNLNEVSLDGETLKGLDDQLGALKKSDAYLFDDQPPAGGSGSLRNPPRDPNTKPAAPSFGKQIAEQAVKSQTVPENPYFK